MRHGIPSAMLAVALAALLAGCSSVTPTDPSQESGTLTVAIAPTRGTASPAAAPPPGDALSEIKAAMVTISSLEAHQADGSWVVVDAGLPVTFDLIEVLQAGGAVALPPDSVPEGSYDALQLKISNLALTLKNNSHVDVPPPGTGWSARLPVDFTVVTGEIVTIQLDLRCDGSFQLIEGAIVFDPEIEVDSVTH